MEGISLRTPPPPWISIFVRNWWPPLPPPHLRNFHKVRQRPPNPSGKVYFREKDYLNCEKTCELFNFTCFLTCFSHLFHRVWNRWDPVNRAFFTESEPTRNPVKNPVRFYKVKKPVKNLLKTYELSQCFSQGRTSQNLWTGHFSKGQNLWKTLWNGRSLPGRCMFARSPPFPNKKNNVADCCLWVTGNPNACI